MKTRISIWSAFGFLVALGWAMLSYLSSPHFFLSLRHEPLVSALMWSTCPLPTAFSHRELYFVWALLLNAATYTVVGLAVETVRFRLHPRPVS